MNPGFPSGAYGFSGFTADDQPYSTGELPQMRQPFAPQGSFAEPPSYPLFQKHYSAGESDSGIDRSSVGFQPDWPQSSPSAPIPSSYLNAPTNGVSPVVGDMPTQYWIDPATQALFAAQARPNTWQTTGETKLHNDPAFVHPQASQTYQPLDEAHFTSNHTKPTIVTNVPLSGLKGNGKHQAFLHM